MKQFDVTGSLYLDTVVGLSKANALWSKLTRWKRSFPPKTPIRQAGARSQPQVGNGRFLLETHRRSAGTLGRLFPYAHKCLLYRQKIVSEATLRKRLSFGLFQLESS